MKRIFAIALSLAGMTLLTGCMTHRDDGYNRSDRRIDNRDNGTVSLSFGSVAFGYSLAAFCTSATVLICAC
jgi:hypothetical protein